MVSFNCHGCNDTLKKPKLDAHYRQRCGAAFDCLDCSRTFWTPGEWKGHTSCVSEEVKYGMDKGRGRGMGKGGKEEKKRVDEEPPSSSASASSSKKRKLNDASTKEKAQDSSSSSSSSVERRAVPTTTTTTTTSSSSSSDPSKEGKSSKDKKAEEKKKKKKKKKKGKGDGLPIPIPTPSSSSSQLKLRLCSAIQQQRKQEQGQGQERDQTPQSQRISLEQAILSLSHMEGRSEKKIRREVLRCLVVEIGSFPAVDRADGDADGRQGGGGREGPDEDVKILFT